MSQETINEKSDRGSASTTRSRLAALFALMLSVIASDGCKSSDPISLRCTKPERNGTVVCDIINHQDYKCKIHETCRASVAPYLKRSRDQTTQYIEECGGTIKCEPMPK